MFLAAFRFSPLFLGLALSTYAAAEQPAEKANAEKPESPTVTPAPTTKPDDKTATDPVLVLPKIQVTQQRLRQIDVELIKIDKEIAREKKHIKSTEVDKALNNEKVTKVAAIFGGNSAKHLSAVAATRVELLEAERGILEAMKLPTTRTEYEVMAKELEQLRTTRRNLDKVRP